MPSAGVERSGCRRPTLAPRPTIVIPLRSPESTKWTIFTSQTANARMGLFVPSEGVDTMSVFCRTTTGQCCGDSKTGRFNIPPINTSRQDKSLDNPIGYFQTTLTVPF